MNIETKLSNRKAGILLHISSLPGKFGIGVLGSNAYKFLDFLEASVQKFWQILPIGPIGYQDILNLDTEARMNFPGTLGGNWQWRFTWEQISDNLSLKFKRLTELYERPPVKRSDVEIEVEE